MKSTILSVAALAAVASASPIKRNGVTDGDILNYALTLEHLEDTFYREGLAKFSSKDFVAAGFTDDNYQKFLTIASDEKTHVSFLTGALTKAKVKPVAECKYNFGYKDVAGFVATASVLEGVGVSAYLGAAASIMSKDYLTAAGSILTIEARHTSYVRNQLKEEPFPQPFDAPLSLDSVYTLAAQFITSCPSDNPMLPVKAFPVITASSATKDATIKTGGTITLTPKDFTVKGTVYAAFITVTGPVFVDVTVTGNTFTVVVPKGIAGQNYVVLTNCNTDATDDTIIAGPAIVEIAGTVGTQ